ncbi:MAG TPA: hypothetical protein VKY81_09340 [Natronosporangium sp.]|nr:hypothetical protein [Natronosporangium sp.]
MGTDRDGEGPPRDGDRPSEQPIDDYPDLPRLPDGVRIPDDPAELADEAERVRAELYGGRARPWVPARRIRHPGSGDGPPFAPAVVLCLAIVVALVSLLALALPRPSGGPETPPASRALPDLRLTDASGQPVHLARLVPAAILLVERCRCDRLISETADAAPPGVTVVVIDRSAPRAPADLPAGARLHLLADPEGRLRAELGLGAAPTDAATVVLADREGAVVQVNPAAGSVEPFRASLTGLG